MAKRVWLSFSQLIPLGILVYEGGKCTIEDCEVFNNSLNGIGIANSTATILKSSVHNNYHYGVVVEGKSQVKVRENSIHANQGSGMKVERDSVVEIEKNKIYQNHEAGLFVEEGQVQIRDNQITENMDYGIALERVSKAVVENNCIHSNTKGAIDEVDSVKVDSQKNDFSFPTFVENRKAAIVKKWVQETQNGSRPEAPPKMKFKQEINAD